MHASLQHPSYPTAAPTFGYGCRTLWSLHVLTKPHSGIATTHHANQCKWLVGGLPCDQCFLTFDELVTHLACEHNVQGPAERKLVCEWCTHRGSCRNQYWRDAFRHHIATHLKISHPCTVVDCNKSFSRVDSLHSHMRKQHRKG